MNSCVIDTSVLLQVARGEPGAERMVGRLRDGVISAVNLAEAVDKLVRDGVERAIAESALRPLAFHIVPFDAAAAWEVGHVRSVAGRGTLSLGDVACLATARALGCGVLTNDSEWAEFDFGVKVELGRKPKSKVN